MFLVKPSEGADRHRTPAGTWLCFQTFASPPHWLTVNINPIHHLPKYDFKPFKKHTCTIAGAAGAKKIGMKNAYCVSYPIKFDQRCCMLTLIPHLYLFLVSTIFSLRCVSISNSYPGESVCNPYGHLQLHCIALR